MRLKKTTEAPPTSVFGVVWIRVHWTVNRPLRGLQLDRTWRVLNMFILVGSDSDYFPLLIDLWLLFIFTSLAWWKIALLLKVERYDGWNEEEYFTQVYSNKSKLHGDLKQNRARSNAAFASIKLDLRPVRMMNCLAKMTDLKRNYFMSYHKQWIIIMLDQCKTDLK